MLLGAHLDAFVLNWYSNLTFYFTYSRCDSSWLFAARSWYNVFDHASIASQTSSVHTLFTSAWLNNSSNCIVLSFLFRFFWMTRPDSLQCVLVGAACLIPHQSIKTMPTDCDTPHGFHPALLPLFFPVTQLDTTLPS
jgi:hypothetical protein